MYHLGKVKVIYNPHNEDVKSSDRHTQATIETWDDNVATIGVEPSIADELREGDSVLVDFTSTSPDRPLPRRVIVKILSGDTSKKAWKAYDELKAKKQAKPAKPESKGKLTN